MDLIERQAAIDAADRADYRGLAVEDVKKVTDEVIKELKNLPPAQPERKMGRWIVRYECPNCGEGRGYAFDTCPMCGADMREGQDG